MRIGAACRIGSSSPVFLLRAAPTGCHAALPGFVRLLPDDQGRARVVGSQAGQWKFGSQDHKDNDQAMLQYRTRDACHFALVSAT
jgi:hypothetical protein